MSSAPLSVPHDAVKHATDNGRIFPRFMVPVPHVRIRQAVHYQAKGALGGEFLVRWNHGDAQIHGTVAVTCEWTTGQRTEPFILLVQRDLVDIPEAADPDPQVAGTVQTILGSEDGIHFRASYMGYHGGAIELAGEGFALSCLAAAQERV
ncbi:hypothetical protein B0H13DRAFT_2349204 [Mycena leptocephala]|nr:hypothetical protein B0H13DRAFT_2369515 [Mycena leptocephala]KAJ7873032.1 hypothetical protein B0H13DRAFT_2349204 [Mycena leptocephala]